MSEIRTGDDTGLVNGPRYKHQASLITLLAALGARERTVYAAEIGVWEGETSECLLRALPLLHLTMVDAWKAPSPESAWYKSGDRVARSEQTVFSAAMFATVDRTLFAEHRRIILPDRSQEAAKLAASTNCRFDLVFIDAGHDYESVRDDIAAWHPLVRQGGILSGHDYGHRRFKGVTQAVQEFAAATGREINTEPGKVWWVRV